MVIWADLCHGGSPGDLYSRSRLRAGTSSVKLTFPLHDLHVADEVLLTGTAAEICAGR